VLRSDVRACEERPSDAVNVVKFSPVVQVCDGIVAFAAVEPKPKIPIPQMSLQINEGEPLKDVSETTLNEVVGDSAQSSFD
jgi:hypothetical protein